MAERDQGRVLIVDDEVDLRETLQIRLEARGYTTLASSAGEEALEILKREPVDLLLTDLMMPGMSGLDLLRAGLELDPHLVGILMTGQATVATAVEALKAGAFDYVTKPFKLSSLAPILTRGMEVRRLRTENVQLQETVSIYELSQAVAARLDAAAILEKLAETAVHQCAAGEAGVWLLTDCGRELYVAAVHGEQQAYRPGDRVRVGEGALGWVAAHREPAALHDVGDDSPSSPAHRSPGGSSVAVPMLAGGNLVGVLAVTAKERTRPYTPGQVKALTILAGTGGAALEHAWLYQKAQREIAERRAAEENVRATNLRLQQALADLQKAQSQIIEQERLRALGQMAGGIAHDFNNALMPVLGYSELLLNLPDGLNDPVRVREFLKLMNTAARDAASVVRRLREFYRQREDDEVFAPVHLERVMEQAIELTRPKWRDQALALGRTVRIEHDLSPVPRIPGDEAQLREVLTNLIFNAIDAMPQGGTLTVRTRGAGEQVVLEVCDTGTGMTEEVRRQCLEPFFTTKGPQGTGLGLSMVYGIVQRHGGILEIESAVGRGTTFRITLSVHLPDGTGGTATPAAGSARPPRPLHVLVVDDEDAVRGITVAYLREDGHRVETARGGHEALEKLGSQQFDLVITDHAMPRMNGGALAQAIKATASSQPVILLTGFGELMAAQDERPAAVDLVLSKPVPLEVLRDAIRRVVDFGALRDLDQ